MTYQDNRTKSLLANNPYSFAPVGAHTQNGSLATAQTVTVPATANALLIQANGQNVRYTIDGSNPTASKGFLLAAGADPVVLMAPTDNTIFKFIETTATAVLEIQAIRMGGL